MTSILPQPPRQKTPEFDVDEANQFLAEETPEGVLRWAIDSFGADLKIATSLGAEDMVLLDMAHRLANAQQEKLQIFTLDTGRLHEETYVLLHRAQQKYSSGIEVVFPDAEQAQELVTLKGPLNFLASVEERKARCFVRKVAPLRRALASSNAWMTGLRAEQSTSRETARVVELDVANSNALGHSLFKINPLLNWSHEQVWDYVATHRVPTNKLHQQGFPSIGCAPCTRAVVKGEHERSGRWWWENAEHNECGLHAS
ncbi:MAG: phosphoadenylyl-sulfate reductase [Deltaproteobacteria bacterium]|nr:phosphoadenylyl-sulfate reductase [Deltaproteobacteria bacterium]